MEKEKKKGIQRFLDFIERGGNKLPHPLTLFWIFCVIIAIISAIEEHLLLMKHLTEKKI